jgi:Transposase IS200 like
MINVPPKLAVSSGVGYIKGKSAIHVARHFLRRERDYAGQRIWARGFFVDVVGRDTEPSKKSQTAARPILPSPRALLASIYCRGVWCLSCDAGLWLCRADREKRSLEKPLWHSGSGPSDDLSLGASGRIMVQARHWASRLLTCRWVYDPGPSTPMRML